MDLGLQGRVALITGGSKGIGQASALGLAREGADIAICARGRELLERVATEMAQQTGRRVLPVVADMNREEDAQRPRSWDRPLGLNEPQKNERLTSIQG